MELLEMFIKLFPLIEAIISIIVAFAYMQIKITVLEEKVKQLYIFHNEDIRDRLKGK